MCTVISQVVSSEISPDIKILVAAGLLAVIATDTKNIPQATPVHTIGNAWTLDILMLVVIIVVLKESMLVKSNIIQFE